MLALHHEGGVGGSPEHGLVVSVGVARSVEVAVSHSALYVNPDIGPLAHPLVHRPGVGGVDDIVVAARVAIHHVEALPQPLPRLGAVHHLVHRHARYVERGALGHVVIHKHVYRVAALLGIYARGVAHERCRAYVQLVVPVFRVAVGAVAVYAAVLLIRRPAVVLHLQGDVSHKRGHARRRQRLRQLPVAHGEVFSLEGCAGSVLKELLPEAVDSLRGVIVQRIDLLQSAHYGAVLLPARLLVVVHRGGIDVDGGVARQEVARYRRRHPAPGIDVLHARAVEGALAQRSRVTAQHHGVEFAIVGEGIVAQLAHAVGNHQLALEAAAAEGPCAHLLGTLGQHDAGEGWAVLHPALGHHVVLGGIVLIVCAAASHNAHAGEVERRDAPLADLVAQIFGIGAVDGARHREVCLLAQHQRRESAGRLDIHRPLTIDH